MRTPTRLILAGCLSVTLLGTGASQALAASASGRLEYCTGADECRYFPDPRLNVTFAAAPGEVNSVSGVTSAGNTRIRDANVGVTPGDRCRSVDSHEVECDPATIVEVLTGDLADTVRLGFASRTDLGSGNDTALGSSQPDLALGGDGNDRMLGRSGDDTFEGGRGADVLGGDSGKDELTGGSGDDRVLGGTGNDRLSGGRGADRLSGGDGRDVLLGGSGSDRLNGGKGRDRFDGGTGADYINAADGLREPVRCGAGRDRVIADRSDVLTGCERIDLR